jgi:1-aminocyclopropane-1-carboxylate deaminase
MPALPKSQLLIYRDDLGHSIVSGNKLHKLKPNIALAKSQGYDSIISFGGAYSNHLHALAWACKKAGLSSIGLVRGELHHELTPTLNDCKSWGMQLFPIERKTYRNLQTNVFANDTANIVDVGLPHNLSELAENSLIIPEGGSNLLAIESVAHAYRPLFSDPAHENITHAICATGTGATLAGLYKAAPAGIKVIGIQAVAEGNATLERIKNWLGKDLPNLDIVAGHLGGFAKMPSDLLEFMLEFESEHNIPLDPIYNGKVMFKLTQMVNDDYFVKTDKVLVIHTGGLQGIKR